MHEVIPRKRINDHSIRVTGRFPLYHMDPDLAPEVEEELLRQLNGEGVRFELPSIPSISIRKPSDLSHHSAISGYDAQIGTPDPEVGEWSLSIPVRLKEIVKKFVSVANDPRFLRPVIMHLNFMTTHRL